MYKERHDYHHVYEGVLIYLLLYVPFYALVFV